MICPSCQTENNSTSQNCKKCAASLLPAQAWLPNWQWHGRALLIILVFLILAYLGLNSFLKPYVRDIPKEVTPWLKASKSQTEK